jgi:hypothetical protein
MPQNSEETMKASILKDTIATARVDIPFRVAANSKLSEKAGFHALSRPEVVNVWHIKTAPAPWAAGDYMAVLWRVSYRNDTGFFFSLMSEEAGWESYNTHKTAWLHRLEGIDARDVRANENWTQTDRHGFPVVREYALTGLTRVLTDTLEDGRWYPVRLDSTYVKHFRIPFTTWREGLTVRYDDDGNMFTNVMLNYRTYRGDFTDLPHGPHLLALNVLEEIHYRRRDTAWGVMNFDEVVHVDDGDIVEGEHGEEVSRNAWEAHLSFANEMIEPNAELTISVSDIVEWINEREEK